MASAEDLSSVLQLITRVEERLAGLRARLYRRQLSRTTAGEELQVIVCRTGAVDVGLPLADVQAVTLVCRLALLTEAPAWVVGVLDYHGVALPVIDVAGRLGAAQQPALSDMIVICRAGHRHVGLLVQSVSEVQSGTTALLGESIHDVPHAPYIAGLARVGDAVIPLLSVIQLVAGVADPENGL